MSDPRTTYARAAGYDRDFENHLARVIAAAIGEASMVSDADAIPGSGRVANALCRLGRCAHRASSEDRRRFLKSIGVAFIEGASPPPPDQSITNGAQPPPERDPLNIPDRLRRVR